MRTNEFSLHKAPPIDYYESVNRQYTVTSIFIRYVPIWKIFDYAKTGSRRSVELPKGLRKPNLTYLA